MPLLTAFFLGLLSSFGAVLPPGMLNLSVATCSLEAGRNKAIRYAAGISVVYFVQTAVAIVGANYLRQNPDILDLLSWWAIPVLAFLAAYFFFKWWREQHADVSVEEQRERDDVVNPFLEGISRSLLNFLAIPYNFALGSWLMSDGILDVSVAAKSLFVAGGAAGAMGLLTAYAFGARWIDNHAHVLTRHVHLIVGSLFVLLAGIQTYRML
ncbi:LysE family transporter [Lewinella sp. IMCC34183]|uniref:LysE family transporter n=1 Tax=Lewinella sp. IMCC34183 TaxID=2248762 RepID=UPI000E220128|nr:LysE family transporter [Lewinella sp. IMCC34183]